MSFGINVKPMLNSHNIGVLKNILNFVNENNKDLPENCVQFIKLGKDKLYMQNSHSAFIYDTKSKSFSKIPITGSLLFIEPINKNCNRNSYNVYYLTNNKSIICDEIEGYAWNRSMNQDHGIRVNRRSFTYNYRNNIYKLSSSVNFLSIVDGEGYIVLIEKSNIINKLDDKTGVSISQLIHFKDYFDHPGLVNMSYTDVLQLISLGQYMSVIIEEKEEKLTLYTLLAIDNSNDDLVYKLISHDYLKDSLKNIDNHIFNNIRVSTASQINNSYTLHDLVPVIKYLENENKKEEEITIYSCNSSNEHIFVTYSKNDEFYSLILNIDENNEEELTLFLETKLQSIFDEETFIVNHMIKLKNNKSLLIEAIELLDSNTDEVDSLLAYKIVTIEESGKIDYASATKGEIRKSEFTKLRFISSAEDIVLSKNVVVSTQKQEKINDEFKKLIENIDEDTYYVEEEEDNDEGYESDSNLSDNLELKNSKNDEEEDDENEEDDEENSLFSNIDNESYNTDIDSDSTDIKDDIADDKSANSTEDDQIKQNATEIEGDVEFVEEEVENILDERNSGDTLHKSQHDIDNQKNESESIEDTQEETKTKMEELEEDVEELSSSEEETKSRKEELNIENNNEDENEDSIDNKNKKDEESEKDFFLS